MKNYSKAIEMIYNSDECRAIFSDYFKMYYYELGYGEIVSYQYAMESVAYDIG